MITVLICDSLADNRKIIRELLARNAAWTIVESDSPKEAFSILAEQDVAVMLTDLDVPDVSGQSFIEALRAQFPQLPTVVITPAGPDKAVVRALLLGAAAYVPRTALARDLSGTVERVLALSEPLPAWDQLRAHWSGTAVRFVIPSDRTWIHNVVQYLQGELSRYGLCGPEDRTRIGMALAEALANAIIHGNLEVSSALREKDPACFERELANRTSTAPYRDRSVQLNASFDPAGATFLIADEGRGFDIGSVPDPTDEENLLKVTGRGLLIMRAFTDKLTFNGPGNEVTMRVIAKPPRAAAVTSGARE